MLIFIISVILTSIICLCFFKKNFWENRYLVLLISAGVALVATLVVNFSVRGKFQTKSEISWSNELYTFYVQDSLLKDSLKTPIIKDFDYYKHDVEEFFLNKKDSVHKQIPVKVLFYTIKNKLYIGYLKTNNKKGCKQGYMQVDKDVCIVKSEADSISYYCEKKLIYDVKPNNWISGISLPRLKTINVFHIPPKYFATIPDSLINKPPF